MAAPAPQAEAELEPPPRLPDEGILVGYSLEHEHRTPPIGFRFAPHPSVGVERAEYLEPILQTGGGHLMTIAPTGAGKGVGCIIPALLRFPGPVIVIDPKGENYEVTAKRRRALGQRVILLDPMRITDAEQREALNPLDLLDPASPQCIDDAAMLASLLGQGIGKQDPRNLFWYQRGEQLLAGLIQHLVTRAHPECHLAELRRLLNLDAAGLQQLIDEEMKQSKDPNVLQLAGMLGNPAVEMVGSYVGMAQNSLEFARGTLIHEATRETTFSLDDVTRGEPLSIYLVIPPDKLESHRSLLRIWIGVLMGAIMRRRAQVPHRTLFILDEAAQLGPLDQLRQAITLMRGYGLQTWSFWQDQSQLQSLYPRDWETMYNNCRVHQSFGFTNLHAAREAGVLSGFANAREILALDADEMILGIAGDEAVIAQKPNYLTDPAFAGLFDENPFYVASTEEIPKRQRPQRRYRRPAPTEPDAAAPVEAPRREPADTVNPFAPVTTVVPPSEESVPVELGGGLGGFPGVRALPPHELPVLLQAVQKALPGASFHPYATVACRLPLDFYPEYALYELVDRDADPPRREFVLRRDDDVRPLGFTNEPFYKLNEELPIQLDDDNVFAYVKLFFRFVRGRHGHFHVLESLEDLPEAASIDADTREQLEAHLAPLELRETTDAGTRVIDARMLFKNALFSSTVEVEAGGKITLGGESLLLEDLPVSAAS